MSFLSRVTKSAVHPEARHGYLSAQRRLPEVIASHVVETGEYLGASYLAARVNTQYGDRAKVRGVEMTYGGGVLLKLAAVVADCLGYGHMGGVSHANVIGTALIGTHVAALGARDGAAAAGRSMQLAAPAPSAAIPAARRTTSVGHLPDAPQPGKFLDLDKVNRIASMHG